MDYCSNCGAQLQSSAKFCVKCGFKLKELEDSQFDDSLTTFPQVIDKPKYSPVDQQSELLSLSGLECLKCGSKTSLTLFTHSVTTSTSHRRYTSYKTKSIKIPVCYGCNSEFTGWTSKHKSTRSSYYDVICLTLCALAFGIGLAFTFWWVSVIIFSLLGLSYVYVGYRQSIKRREDSPHRYVKFRGNNTYIRPKGNTDWVNYQDWLRQTSYDNVQELGSYFFK